MSGWTRSLPIIVTGLAAVLVVLFGLAALDEAVDWWAPFLVIGLAVGAEILVIALLSHKPLTALGAEVRDHLAGLQVFIEWAEADRIRMLQSPQGAERVRIDTTDRRQMLKLYETLLPYAVVFGQEKQWAKELAVLYGETGTPVWYSGSSGFNASAFSAGIGTLSTSTGPNTFYSALDPDARALFEETGAIEAKNVGRIQGWRTTHTALEAARPTA